MYKKAGLDALCGLNTVDITTASDRLILVTDLLHRVLLVPVLNLSQNADYVSLLKDIRKTACKLDKLKRQSSRLEAASELSRLNDRARGIEASCKGIMAVLGATVDLDDFFSIGQLRRHFPHLFDNAHDQF